MSLRRSAPRRPASLRYSAGFTLLEVLVSILILSFGVLGAAGMQIAALQANKEARYQSTAVRLGAQLADLMRSNVALARQSTSANVFLLDNVTKTFPKYTDDCVSASCATAAAQAQFEVQSWLNQLNDPLSGLPGAKVVVCFDDTPFDAKNKPQWDCSGVKSAATRPYIKIGWVSSDINPNAKDSSKSAFDKATTPKLVLDVIPG